MIGSSRALCDWKIKKKSSSHILEYYTATTFLKQRGKETTFYLMNMSVNGMSTMIDCVNNYWSAIAIVGISINLIYVFYERLGKKDVVF